jgi:hypothetical protein
VTIREIEVGSGLLHAKVVGEFRLDEAQNTFLQLLESIAQHKAHKVLFNGLELSGNPDTIERFYYGSFVAEAVFKFEDKGVSQFTPFAYVLKEPVRDPGRFGETVAVNRFMRVKVFDNVDDALSWLK